MYDQKPHNSYYATFFAAIGKPTYSSQNFGAIQEYDPGFEVTNNVFIFQIGG